MHFVLLVGNPVILFKLKAVQWRLPLSKEFFESLNRCGLGEDDDLIV